MKKLTLITMLFVLFLGTRCQALTSARATFFGKRECHAAGSHAQRCRILSGDTLSKDALAVYGDWHLYSTTLMGANLKIVDENKIYADSWIIIPDAPSNQSTAAAPATSHVQSHVVVTSAATPLMNLKQIHSTIAMESPPEFSAEIPMESITSFPVRSAEQSLPLTTKVAEAQPPPAPLPTNMEATAAKPMRITGYKLVIPQSVAMAMGGIPLKCALKTEVLSYASDEAKVHNAPGGYLHLKDSWAQKEGDTIALYVPKDLPKKPFNLFIAGVHDPIDGKIFMVNTETFQGKFPGPNRTGKRIFSGLMIGANGYMFASALGPVAGPSVMGGMLITRAIMKHHAEAMLKKAEDRFNTSLTGGKAPSDKELGQ